MAVKFKSKYTAQEIEQLLDSIDAASKGAFVQVDELPDVTDANTSMFYLCDGKVYYIDTTTRDWAEIQTGGGDNDSDSDNVISTDEFEFNQLNYTDFELTTASPIEHFKAENNATASFLEELISIMQNKDANYYKLTGVTGEGWIEGFDGNNIVQVQASFAQDTDEQYVFIMLTLVNGIQVRLAQNKTDHSLWIIEYMGYAL